MSHQCRTGQVSWFYISLRGGPDVSGIDSTPLLTVLRLARFPPERVPQQQDPGKRDEKESKFKCPTATIRCDAEKAFDKVHCGLLLVGTTQYSPVCVWMVRITAYATSFYRYDATPICPR